MRGGNVRIHPGAACRWILVGTALKEPGPLPCSSFLSSQFSTSSRKAQEVAKMGNGTLENFVLELREVLCPSQQ